MNDDFCKDDHPSWGEEVLVWGVGFLAAVTLVLHWIYCWNNY